MSDSTISVDITADPSGLESGMAQAASAANDAFAQIQASGRQMQDGLGETTDSFTRQQQTQLNQLSRSWMETFRPITQAFDRSVTGMIMGTTTWQKAVSRLGQSILAEEINSNVKRLASWASTELAKTELTQAGTATRSASETASQGSFLTQIAERLLKWLGLESSETAATDTGSTTRTASQVAASVAGNAAAVAAGFGQIEIDAAVAAAGAMAATAAIPFIGPELAPAAAAAAYAETMGWASGLGGGLASAAGGMWEVPGTILSVLHPQESVIPASVANPMRDFFAGSSASGGAGAGGANVTFAPQVSALDSRSVVALFNTPSIMRSFAKNLGAYMAMNPSARGQY